MRILVLTDVGDSMASAPTNNPSVAMKILYWLRRRGGKGTDDQLSEYVESDRGQLQLALNKLIRAKAITIVGR